MSKLSGKTVVITGATSGIGRAAAEAFAREGVNLILTARRTEVLHEVSRECSLLGAKDVLVVTADFTDGEAMRDVARRAVERFGRLDVWLNDPGVGAMGRFDETPLASHEQVLRTNLIGYFNGAHAALPYFKRQGAGTLINMNSLGAFFPVPFAAAYSASKFGLRGFSEALRGELATWPDIHVCDVFPGCVDSPGMRHAANYLGREVKPAPPLVSPYRVARTIVSLAENPRPSHMIGSQAWSARLAYFFAPRLMMWTLGFLGESFFKRAKPAPVKDGNLFAASTWTQETGEWRNWKARSLVAALGLYIGFDIIRRGWSTRGHLKTAYSAGPEGAIR